MMRVREGKREGKEGREINELYLPRTYQKIYFQEIQNSRCHSYKKKKEGEMVRVREGRREGKKERKREKGRKEGKEGREGGGKGKREGKEGREREKGRGK